MVGEGGVVMGMVGEGGVVTGMVGCGDRNGWRGR
jgi:hypothetical protein